MIDYVEDDEEDHIRTDYKITEEYEEQLANESLIDDFIMVNDEESIIEDTRYFKQEFISDENSLDNIEAVNGN